MHRAERELRGGRKQEALVSPLLGSEDGQAGSRHQLQHAVTDLCSTTYPVQYATV
jgi:hypothetical protein